MTRGPCAVAQPPAGDRVGLAEAVHDERLRIVLGGRDERRVVAEMAIDFVAQQNDVPPGGQLGDAADFGLRSHNAGRIRGAVEDDHLRPWGDRCRHAIHVDPEIGIRIDVDDFRPGYRGQRVVHHEIRIEDDHFFAGIQEHEHRQHDAAAGPAADENFAVVMTEFCRYFGLQLIAQRGNALREGVAVLAVLDGLYRRAADRFGRLEVGLADGKIDRIGQLRAQVEDLADAGGIVQAGAVGEPVGRHGEMRFVKIAVLHLGHRDAPSTKNPLNQFPRTTATSIGSRRVSTASHWPPDCQPQQ